MKKLVPVFCAGALLFSLAACVGGETPTGSASGSPDPGTSAQEMVECIRVDKATLTKTIKKLSDIGYVRIVSDPQDRRVKRLFLTQEGIPAVQRVKEIHGAFFQTLCAGIPPQDIQAAQRTLARMVENLTPVVRHRMEDPHAAQ